MTNERIAELPLRTVGKSASSRKWLLDFSTILNKITLLKFCVMGNEGFRGRNLVAFYSLWSLKKGHLNFRLPIKSTQSEIYTTARSIKVLYASGIAYNHWHWALAGFVHPGDIVICYNIVISGTKKGLSSPVYCFVTWNCLLFEIVELWERVKL